MQEDKQLTHKVELPISGVKQTGIIQTAKPAHRTTSGSEAVRCGGEVEKDLTDAMHQSVSTSQGTPPSNTVPPNDKNKHFKALLSGIDSLYLSYYGRLADDWDKKLFELKENAQSEDEKTKP